MHWTIPIVDPPSKAIGMAAVATVIVVGSQTIKLPIVSISNRKTNTEFVSPE